MKRLSWIAVVALVASIAGCGQTSDNKGKGTPGKGADSSKATDSSKGTDPQGKALSVTGPGDTSIKQGGTTDVKVSIKRTGFTDPVKVTFTLPKGVTLDSKDTTIPKDATSGTFTLKAADDAPVTDKGEASVTAEGGDKKPEPARFNIKVIEK